MNPHCSSKFFQRPLCLLLLCLSIGCTKSQQPVAPETPTKNTAATKQRAPKAAETPPTGLLKLDFRVDPAGTSISIDGNEFTAKELVEPMKLPVGEHKLVVTHTGKDPETIVFAIEADKRRVVEVVDHERSAAVWALGIGARSITINVGGQEKQVTMAGALPKELFSVVVLDFPDNKRVGDNDLREVRGLGSLRLLHVRSGNVTDAAMVNLAGLRQLRHLELHGTLVGDKGVAELVSAPLESLWLGETQITDEGLKHLNPSVRRIELSYTKITDRGLEYLTMCKDLLDLNIEGDAAITDAGIAHLSCLTALRLLWATKTKMTNAGLAHLSSLSALESLSLGETAVTDEGLQYLRGLTRLGLLNLSGTRVTGAGLGNVKGLPLADFNLAGAPVDDSGLEKLRDIKSLRMLWLRGTKVTATGVAKLKEALPDCRFDVDPEIESALKSKK